VGIPHFFENRYIADVEGRRKKEEGRRKKGSIYISVTTSKPWLLRFGASCSIIAAPVAKISGEIFLSSPATTSATNALMHCYT